MTVPDDPQAVPWAPEDLPVHPDSLVADWWYVVLEEIVDDIALLRRWSWPVVDQLGRLTWPGDSEQRTVASTIDVDLLRRQLYLSNGIARAPRVGDTFAVEIDHEIIYVRRAGPLRNLRRVFAARVFDISADAREAAKIAYQSGLASVITADAIDADDRERQQRTLARRAANPLPVLTVADPDAPVPGGGIPAGATA